MARIQHRRRSKQKGQAEVIGGLVVLTLLFMLALPMILNSYQNVQQSLTLERQNLAKQTTMGNQRLTVGPVVNNTKNRNLNIYPGIWINNTGTLSVTLKYLYLINQSENSIFAIIDLSTARPGNNPLIVDMRLNFQLDLIGELPPPNTSIVLDPGDTLLIVLDEAAIGPRLDTLVALVESSNGIIYPRYGVGYTETLAGIPIGGGNATIPRSAIWRGIFAPRSGFYLEGYDELMKYGIVETWRPPLRIYSAKYNWWSGFYPSVFDFRSSFIYEDPLYPGLYMLNITTAENIYIVTPSATIYVSSGSNVVIRGFIGTYTFDGGNYFSGYAYEVWVNGRLKASASNIYTPSTTSYGRYDFDGNGVDELVFYSYLNGPNLPRSDVDADGDGDSTFDSLIWSYIITRDIGNSDFVQITAKINYYWTKIFSSSTGCPSNYRKLKIFSLVAWEYDNTSGKWVIYQYKNFGYTNEKPVQFQVSATFPLNRSHIYRIGIMFYDPYRDFDYNYYCSEEFTFSIEHLMVEYGVVNPFFSESPPVYIVAIQDPNYISNIGEVDYMSEYNLTNLSEAKIEAQQQLLNNIVAELNYAGISGYTIIHDRQTLLDLLFNGIPPRYAIVIYLQGDTPISYLTGGAIDDADLKSYIQTYNWTFVQVSGEPLWGNIGIYNYYARVDSHSPALLTTITDAGKNARTEFYAYALPSIQPYNYTVWFISPSDYSRYVVWNATFYVNETLSPEQLGLVAFYTDNGIGGILIVNGVHIDWDNSGDGVRTETLVQEVVYSSLYAWNVLRNS